MRKSTWRHSGQDLHSTVLSAKINKDKHIRIKVHKTNWKQNKPQRFLIEFLLGILRNLYVCFLLFIYIHYGRSTEGDQNIWVFILLFSWTGIILKFSSTHFFISSCIAFKVLKIILTGTRRRQWQKRFFYWSLTHKIGPNSFCIQQNSIILCIPTRQNNLNSINYISKIGMQLTAKKR